jgi:endonuclease/exonuclease/phosphatase family metal-dependent hydrolase
MRRRTLVSLVLSTWVATGCTAGSPAPSDGAGSPAGQEMTVAVGTFNIEYGGTLVDFDKVVEAVRAGGADILGIEEAWGNTERLADELGWSFDPRTQVISRFPVLDPPDADGRFVYVQVRPGAVVAVANVHLTSSPYTPNKLVRGEIGLDEVIEQEERVRLPELEPVLDAVVPQHRAGVPTFLLGDFNTPSHLDYVEEAVGSRPEIPFAVEWPVTVAAEEAGFVDSFRAVHPDPVAVPGLTWPAGRPELKGEWNPPEGAPNDRIDLVMAAGPATPTASVVVGEEGADGVDVTVDPWPSDHRSVVSTFAVVPASPPEPLVAATPRLVDAGDPVDLTWIAPGVSEIAVTGNGSDAHAVRVDAAAGTVPVEGLDVGRYAVEARGAGGVLATAPLWIREPGSGPVIATSKDRYEPGEPIDVSWTNAPGNRWDWIGLYRRGADPDVAWYLNWFYTRGEIEGRGTFDDGSEGKWPRKPGEYTVYYLIDDGYDEVARVDIEIVPGG